MTRAGSAREKPLGWEAKEKEAVRRGAEKEVVKRAALRRAIRRENTAMLSTTLGKGASVKIAHSSIFVAAAEDSTLFTSAPTLKQHQRRRAVALNRMSPRSQWTRHRWLP